MTLETQLTDRPDTIFLLMSAEKENDVTIFTDVTCGSPYWEAEK